MGHYIRYLQFSFVNSWLSISHESQNTINKNVMMDYYGKNLQLHLLFLFKWMTENCNCSDFRLNLFLINLLINVTL